MSTAKLTAEEQSRQLESSQPDKMVEALPSLENDHGIRPILSRALVFDDGPQTIKYGYGGDTAPTSELLSVVGRMKYKLCWMGGRGMLDYPVGANALEKKALLNNRWPIQGTRVENWDDVEVLWWNAFHQELKVDPTDHPLLITAPLSLTPKDSERMTTLVFEYFDCPEFFASDSAPLALYAAGRTTGLVVDSGHCRTVAVPVYEGFPLAKAVHYFDIAGRDITKHLGSLLADSYPTANNLKDELTVRDIKEYCCYITDDPYPTIVNKRWEEQSYTLPDGNTIIHLGTERFRAPEPMFSPIIGLPTPVMRAILKSDVKLRDDMSRDILLVGGNTLFPGFADRLQQGLTAITPSIMKAPSVVTPPDAKNLAWRGGSMLSSLSTFRDFCIQAKEFEEYGPVLMWRKCWGIGL